MRPFPDAKNDPLGHDPVLQSALDTAMASTPSPPTGAAIAIVSINQDGSRGYAGRLEYTEYYSASLLKVAAMYAAFELRKACNEALAGSAPADAFQALRNDFDDVIRANRLPRLAGLADLYLLPKYDQIFTYDPLANQVNFAQLFWNDLFAAIADGDNPSAGRCVQRLGFGYITTALSEANFFDADTDLGIWLCGDFGIGFPPQRIPCSNDGPTAQGATAYQMAKLFTLLADSQLVDPAGDAAMRDLLQQAILRLHLFLNRDTTVQYVTLYSKIGLGPVNAGFSVASEALVVQENTTNRQFVVVFQNQPRASDVSIFPVARVIDATIASFLFP
ncbi:class A beta-lactamase-related serine hydrolase [Rhizobium rhizogenes]|uniref:hypothetical protein n=1 Tax=Rhizobium rhizogenes TaxID=359 RepID=UPI003ED13E3F